MDKLISIRKGGDVKRFHTVTMIRENTVAAHSWGVATLIFDVFPNASVELIKAALYHDVAEHVTGDVSAPTKWRYPKLAEALTLVEHETEADLGIDVWLDQEDKLILKFCDMADLVMTCVQEYRLGNKDALDIVRRGLTYLEDRSWTSHCRNYLPKIKRYVEEQVK